MSDIKEFINSEIEYFRPINERYLYSSTEDREIWRLETIRQRQKRISIEVYNKLSGIVKYGPFRGMKLSMHPWWGELDLGSQCLGLYELEVLNFIDSVPDNYFKNFIDIGAADGYYAIGMLVSEKVKNVFCFESSKEGRNLIRENWILNGSIGNLKIFEEANKNSFSNFNSIDLNKSLVLIDIEGAEFDLMDEAFFLLFRHSTIILEVHNWIHKFQERYSNLLMLASRFFNIKIVDRVDRLTINLDELRDFTDDNRLLLVSERRPCVMRFLMFEPL